MWAHIVKLVSDHMFRRPSSRPDAERTEGERPASPADGARRSRLLDAALTVFLRYGFRKTSMEEVARAAQVSRQALYLHFATKEELFAAAVQHYLALGLEAAVQPLRDASLALEAQLLAAFDAWFGRFV